MTEFRISDNGIGISKQDIIKLFKQFPDIPQEGGVDSTGLGLSICKGIIDLHKGRIWAESEGEGKGTTFIFTIPNEQDEIYVNTEIDLEANKFFNLNQEIVGETYG